MGYFGELFGMRREKVPTLSDVPAFVKMQGGAARQVGLIVPHSNEAPAVWRFRDSLTERLRSSKLRVEHSEITDTQQRGWDLRNRLGDFEALRAVLSKTLPRPPPKNQKEADEQARFASINRNPMIVKITEAVQHTNQVAGSVLMLVDYHKRLSLIRDHLSSQGGKGAVLELHAMETVPGKSYGKDVPFHAPSHFYRLKDTRLLVIDLPPSIESGLRYHLGVVGQNMAEAQRIAALCDVDLAAMLSGFDSLRATLATHAGQVWGIELPAWTQKLKMNHPMYNVYFPSSVLAPSALVSPYEYKFCFQGMVEPNVAYLQAGPRDERLVRQVVLGRPSRIS